MTDESNGPQTSDQAERHQLDDVGDDEAALSGAIQDELPTEDTSGTQIPVEGLVRYLDRATSGGLFPVIAHGLDPDEPDAVTIATAPIRDLPRARQIVERVHGDKIYPFQYVPSKTLKYIGRTNHAVQERTERVEGFDSRKMEHLKALSHLVQYCTASLWEKRAFLLVDMVGFSQAASAEQLALRLSLGQAISQCQQRMYRLKQRGVLRDTRFNRISAGDGFYLWSYDDGLDGHLATLALMVLLMAQVRALEEAEAIQLELRAAYGIGEAFIFPYDGPAIPQPRDVFKGFRPDAIGPALNDLNRLVDAAYPSQMLIQPFDLPGRKGRSDERFDVPTALTILKHEILPHELAPTDAVKPQEIQLTSQPATPYRVVDKHKLVHHCYNVTGSVATRDSGQVSGIQRIGLLPDDSKELLTSSFVRG